MTYGTDMTQTIVEKLFQPDMRRLKEMLHSLIEENHSLGNPKEGFLFRGQFYSQLPRKQQARVEKKILHSCLHEKGNKLFDDFDLVLKESKRVMQGLHILLRDCHCAQDVRDALPDTAQVIFPPDVAACARTREPGWPLKDKPLHLKQFEEIFGLLDFYASNRILY